MFLDLGMRRMRDETWSERALLVTLTGSGQDPHRRRSKAAGFDRQHMTRPADAESPRSLLRRQPLTQAAAS